MNKLLKKKVIKCSFLSSSKQVLEKSFQFGTFNGGKVDVIEEFFDFLKLQLSFELNGFLALWNF